MVRDIRTSDLGGQMEVHGAKELDIFVAARIFKWKTRADIEKEGSDVEDVVAGISAKLPPGATIGFEAPNLKTRRITSAAFALGGKIRRATRGLLYSILTLSAALSCGSRLVVSGNVSDAVWWKEGMCSASYSSGVSC